ncbi:MAG: hypothetical protein KF730_17135 [Sphingomonas sp.]|nr:hypothetical protein [Sphingomonas sp.]MBX3566288.1 hypothetical protein [Sphingomonas sp.]
MTPNAVRVSIIERANGAAGQFARWNKAMGKCRPASPRRRATEAQLYSN